MLHLAIKYAAARLVLANRCCSTLLGLGAVANRPRPAEGEVYASDLVAQPAYHQASM